MLRRRFPACIALIAGATALGGGINGMFQGLADDEVNDGG